MLSTWSCSFIFLIIDIQILIETFVIYTLIKSESHIISLLQSRSQLYNPYFQCIALGRDVAFLGSSMTIVMGTKAKALDATSLNLP